MTEFEERQQGYWARLGLGDMAGFEETLARVKAGGWGCSKGTNSIELVLSPMQSWLQR